MINVQPILLTRTISARRDLRVAPLAHQFADFLDARRVEDFTESAMPDVAQDLAVVPIVDTQGHVTIPQDVRHAEGIGTKAKESAPQGSVEMAQKQASCRQHTWVISDGSAPVVDPIGQDIKASLPPVCSE